MTNEFRKIKTPVPNKTPTSPPSMDEQTSIALHAKVIVAIWQWFVNLHKTHRPKSGDLWLADANAIDGSDRLRGAN